MKEKDSARKEKIELHVKELVATFLGRESNKTAMITVTRVEIIDRGRTGTIYITVLPVDKEEVALAFVKRKLPDIRAFIKPYINTHTIPFFSAAIDSGEKARQTIETLLKE